MNKPKKYLKVESIHGVEVNLPIHRIQRESGYRKGLAAIQVSKETLEEVEKLMLGL